MIMENVVEILGKFYICINNVVYLRKKKMYVVLYMY